jgi:uncharacterized membrane protein (UPF0136 family)
MSTNNNNNPIPPNAINNNVKKYLDTLKLPGESHNALGMGVVLIAGGTLAFIRRRSFASLGASVLVGSGYLVGVKLMSDGEMKNGHFLCAMSGGVLTVTSGLRARLASKPMIPIALAALGAASTTYELMKFREWQ